VSRARAAVVVGPSRREGNEVRARVSVAGSASDVSFRARGASVHPHDDAFVPVALLLGMALGLPAVVEGPVSERLLETLPRARADLVGLYPGLADVALEAPRPVPGAAPGPPGGVLCFFSGGLDSFYSLLSHRDEVSHVVFVHGFDVPLDDAASRATVSRSLRAAAQEMGKAWVEVETDLRVLCDRHASWTWYSHAGLAAVSLLLSASFSEVLFGATLADEHRADAGPNDERARVWDNGLACIRRDGGEATRVAKAARVATDPTARRFLRVCWANPGGAWNCGACPKCVRTMASLELAGGLALFPGFPARLDLHAVRSQRLRRRRDRLFAEENLRAAEGSPGHAALAAALRESLRQPRWRRLLERLSPSRRRARRRRVRRA
jgi:hypothetical protein